METYIPFVRGGGILPTTKGVCIPLVRSNGETTTPEDSDTPEQNAPTPDTTDTNPDREKD